MNRNPFKSEQTHGWNVLASIQQISLKKQDEAQRLCPEINGQGRACLRTLPQALSGRRHLGGISVGNSFVKDMRCGPICVIMSAVR